MISFDHLPEEILVRILSNLDAPSLGRMGFICSKLNRIANDTTLWRPKIQSAFPHAMADQMNRQTYLRLVKEKSSRRVFMGKL